MADRSTIDPVLESEITWAELGALSLRRQFPVASRVTELVELIGPIQAQAARAPFLGIAARLATAGHASITAAYEGFDLVRGSTIRGTVHTSTAGVHPILDVLTRVSMGTRWAQVLHLDPTAAEHLWADTEAYAYDTWRTVPELRTFLFTWLSEHDSPAAAKEAAEGPVARYLAFAHGGLIRRPLTGGWEGQGRPGYRAAAAVLGDRSDWYADRERVLRDAVRLHIRCHGPSSRHDIAWWSGVSVKLIDTALASLNSQLTVRTGPDGRAYHDLIDQADSLRTDGLGKSRDLPAVALLPEFDALLCGYDPPGRARFIAPEHHQVLFQQANGLIRPLMLVDGRITGYWRLEGSGRRRALTAYWFPGTRRPRVTEVRQAALSVTRALPLTLTEVQVRQHGPVR